LLSIKGEIKQKTITIEYLGGEVGNKGLKVSDLRIPSAGENLLLFLKQNSDEIFKVVGKAQGQYSIDQESGMVKSWGYSILNGAESEAMNGAEQNTKEMHIEDLKKLIKKAMNDE